MADLATLGFFIDTKPLADTKKSLDDVTASAGKAQKAVTEMADASSGAAAKVAQAAAMETKAVEGSAAAAVKRRSQYAQTAEEIAAIRAGATEQVTAINKVAAARAQATQAFVSQAAIMKTAAGGSGGGFTIDAASGAAAVASAKATRDAIDRANAARTANRAASFNSGANPGGPGGPRLQEAMNDNVAQSALSYVALAQGVYLAAAAYAALLISANRISELHERELRVLTTLTGSRTQANELYQGIAKYADQAGISIEEATAQTIKFSQAGATLGATAQTMVGVSVTIEKLGQLSGASPGKSDGAQGSIAKMLASGKVSADDLKSVLQTVPQVTDQIALGLGVSVTQLRLMAVEGKLSSEQVFEALLKQQKDVNAEFDKMPRTVGQNLQIVGNNVLQLGQNFSKILPGVRELVALLDLAAKGSQKLNELITPDSPRVAADKLSGVGITDRGIFSNNRQKRAADANAAVGVSDNAKTFSEIATAAKPYSDALEKAVLAANGIDGVTAKLIKLNETGKDLQKGLDALHSGVLGGIASPEVQMRIDQLTDAIRRNRIEIANTQTATEKLTAANELRANQDEAHMTANERALAGKVAALTGATGSTSSGDATEAAAKLQVDKESLTVAKDSVETFRLQVEANERLAAAAGHGKQAMIDATIASALLDWQLKHLGATSEEVEVQLDALSDVIGGLFARDAKAKGKIAAAGGANPSKALLDELASVTAAMKVVEQGAYAMKRAEAQGKADRATDGTGKLQMQVFDAKQGLTDATTVLNIKRQVDLTNQLAAAAGDVVKQKQIQLDFDIKKAQMDAGPAARSAIDESMRAQAMAESNKALAELLATGQKYIEAQGIEQQAVWLSEEAAQALRLAYEMQNQAKAAGVDLTPAVVASIQASADAQAAAARNTKEQKQLADLAKTTFTGMFSDIRTNLLQGQSAWEAFGNAGMNALDKIASKLLDMATSKIFDAAFGGAAGAGGGFLGSILGGIFGGGASAAGAGGSAASAASAVAVFAANGAAFQAGNVIPFAKGGVFDKPTTFPMADGRTGMLGEAQGQAEGILPLIRGPSGKLGVSSTGDSHTSGGSREITVSISLDNELLRATARDEFGKNIAVAGQRIESSAVKKANKAAPSVMAADHAERGGDWRVT